MSERKQDLVGTACCALDALWSHLVDLCGHDETVARRRFAEYKARPASRKKASSPEARGYQYSADLPTPEDVKKYCEGIKTRVGGKR